MQRTVEKYEILEEIGHGGMATVFRARDTRLDRLVALKILHPHLRGSREAQARFRREAQGVARLRHQRVLEIYDYSGEGSEESWIATELLTGPTLKKLAEDHPPMLAEFAAAFGIEVCRALTHAHEAGIVHRDVKPENILLHQDRELKLTDFGIADMVDQHTMTATGQILGSPGHMAPEQIEGKDTDARTDVFALGTVLYFLACGRLPFVGRNPAQVLRRISEGEYPDPQRVRPQIGGKMREILQRTLAHDPADRYASAAELEETLRAFLLEVTDEEPESLVESYLQDPAAATAALSSGVVKACIERGKAARSAGRVPEALDYFGRVLSLDEGNAEVLELIESVDRGRKQRSALFAGLGSALLATLIAGGAFAFGAFDPPTPAAVVGEPDAAVALMASAPDAGQAETDAATEALAAADEVDAAVEEPDAGAAVAVVSIPRPPSPPIRPRAAPRLVEFDMDPVSVSVGVDGSTPRSIGTFRSVELNPGPHRFLVRAARIGGVECCVAREVVEDIPPGDGPYTLSVRLVSHPATLVVTTNVPADVDVGNGRVVRRANESISVPLADGLRTELLPITVTAAGFAPYTMRVLLSAGSVLERRVVLQPEAAVEEAPHE